MIDVSLISYISYLTSISRLLFEMLCCGSTEVWSNAQSRHWGGAGDVDSETGDNRELNVSEKLKRPNRKQSRVGGNTEYRWN